MYKAQFYINHNSQSNRNIFPKKLNRKFFKKIIPSKPIEKSFPQTHLGIQRETEAKQRKKN